MDAQLQKKIEDLLKSSKIILFMKGTPQMPQCGFSAKTAAILKSYSIEFNTFDILEDEDIRQALAYVASYLEDRSCSACCKPFRSTVIVFPILKI